MNERTIFIILVVVSVGLATVTGVLAWDNMQPKGPVVHKIDISNNSSVNESSSNTGNSDFNKDDDDLDHDDSHDDYYDDSYDDDYDPYEGSDDDDWWYEY